MNHLSYVDGLLEGQDYLIDNEFSGADLQLTFNLQGANAGGGLRHYKNTLKHLCSVWKRVKPINDL